MSMTTIDTANLTISAPPTIDDGRWVGARDCVSSCCSVQPEGAPVCQHFRGSTRGIARGGPKYTRTTSKLTGLIVCPVFYTPPACGSSQGVASKVEDSDVATP
jgi:hypothetical protein